MTQNVGQIDRIVRALVGVGLIYLALFSGMHAMHTPLWKYLALAVGVVMLAVAALRICPLYSIFGIKTCPR